MNHPPLSPLAKTLMDIATSAAFTPSVRSIQTLEAAKRAVCKSYAPSDQLTPWEAVVMGDGSTEIRARFKRGGRNVWQTLTEMPYLTGSGDTAHNGAENAARVAHAMNVVYPIKAQG